MVPEIGKYYKAVIRKEDSGGKGHTKLWGKCIYIHPQLRFITLEFPDLFREAYPLDEISR